MFSGSFVFKLTESCAFEMDGVGFIATLNKISGFFYLTSEAGELIFGRQLVESQQLHIK